MVKNKLIWIIENKRKELHNCVNKNGFLSKEALKCSEELDSLINKYYKC
ncbi:aspartyl-phosphate phosphatase Spo0E family protein [Salipaludibacillus daqingensis]|nr:aspartyl-phosphate phosphatase Spo0E family protein [Salipaludibacillus daqingensis]